MLPPLQLLYLYLLLLLSEFFGIFVLKRVGSKNWNKGGGGQRFARQNFEVGVSVLVEKMHTPESETKKYHFSKTIACRGRPSCNFTHKMFISGIRDSNFI